jgi:hypothetical protein
MRLLFKVASGGRWRGWRGAIGSGDAERKRSKDDEMAGLDWTY